MSGTTRGRPRAFERDVVLDAAVRMFWAKGYEATSVRDLTEALGLSAPSLYNAFGDKRQLFAEAVTAYERDYGGFIAAALAEESTALLAVDHIFADAPAYFARSGLPPGCLVVSGDAGSADPNVRQVLQEVRERQVASIAELVRRDVASGTLHLAKAGLSPDALARFVMIVVGGIAQQAREGIAPDDLTALAAVARALWADIARP
jgi:AcrR family transcriptional regulator